MCMDLFCGFICGLYGRNGVRHIPHTAEDILRGLEYFAHLYSLSGMDVVRLFFGGAQDFALHDFSALKQECP